MNDYSRQMMNTSLLLTGGALLALTSPPATVRLALPLWMASEHAAVAAGSCVATEPGAAPRYLDAVATSLANSDGPVSVDLGCGALP